MSSNPQGNPPLSDLDTKATIPISRIGRYEILYQIGQGGMASVYVGKASGMAGFEKLVAIKVVHPHLVKEKMFVEMFIDEAKLAAQILHPNVAAVHEVDMEGDLLYMVGELVQGESLISVVKKARSCNTHLSQPMAAHIVASICAGLHAAHELQDPEGKPLNLVHRDISPQNILISYTGFIKLIDFGVAQAKGRISYTEAGTIKGKMGYLSPEQITGMTLDRRSDIFSLGVVMYQLITGKHPFPGTTDLERLNRIRLGKFLAPREVDPAISAAMERIVITALAPKREDRFPSAASLASTLNAYLRSQNENVGSRQLSDIMMLLFKTEIAAEREKARLWRERGENALAAEASKVGATQAAVVRREERPAIAEEIRKTRRVTLFPWIVGAVIAAVLIGAAFLYFGRGTVDAERIPVPKVAASPPIVKPAGAAEVKTAEPQPDDSAESPETVRFEFDVTPAFAKVRFDGELLAPGVREKAVEASGKSHRIECLAKGYATQTKEVAASVDQSIVCKLVANSRSMKATKAPEGGDSKPAGEKSAVAAPKSEPEKPNSKLKESPY